MDNASTGDAEASYVYGPDGSLFSATEGSSTTLYLNDEQLTDNDGTITGVRYYSLPGGVTAVRTGSSDDYGFEITSDQHGTNTLYLDDTAQDPTWRQFDPFGNTRGTAPAAGSFPDDERGFLNDPGDPLTGLTNIGARWYDPTTGTFTSLDPVLETSSPTELNGYSYAGNDPVNSSDPTGEMPMYDTPDGTYTGYAPSAEKVYQEQEDYNTLPPYEPSYTPEPSYYEYAPPPAPKLVIHTVTAKPAGPSCTMGGAPADGGCASPAAGEASSSDCVGRMIQLGACASESGLAGTTPAQVKQAGEGAIMVLGGALLDPALGLAGLLGDAGNAAEEAGAAGREITTYYPPNDGFFGESTSQTLEAGARIDRYGGEGGTFVSPEGTSEAMRALPPGATERPYNIYEVVNAIEVRAGTIAPAFGQLGLGTQYVLPDSVANLIENGYLKLAEDFG